MQVQCHHVFGRSDLRGRNEDPYRYGGHFVMCLGGLVKTSAGTAVMLCLGGLILEVGSKICTDTVVTLCCVWEVWLKLKTCAGPVVTMCFGGLT